ncbi:hypothetical protein L1785_08675 [Antribacter sp. KLBMP9083]|uniref:Uncharacterized protein n=1 Tax=Antribacter soli TaxID=2910976 RepID=A0AA41QE04_9MICO|nr:hypothetical protein [Antribacter soli]MCF4121055.1 hypothetical protein [Antribacter soli]
MLAVVAAGYDTGAHVLTRLLRTAGAKAEVVESFTELCWDLTITADSTASARVSMTSGDTVDAIVLRSVPGDDDPFCSAEQSASWWALLSSFPGPVIGRPTSSGMIATIDRLRLDDLPVWAGRWALRDAVPAGGHGHDGGYVRPGADGAPGEYLHEVQAGEEVVDITPCSPSSTVRVVVAGLRTLVVPGTGTVPVGVLRAAAGAFATGAPVLASVVVDHSHDGRVLDVGPVPAGLLDSPLGEAIAAGVLEAVR